MLGIPLPGDLRSQGVIRGVAPYEIIGSSGWKGELIDDDGELGASPARHFVGWVAAGFFHPHLAGFGLAEPESPGVAGASVPDILSGRIAIDVGIKLRRGRINRLTLINEVIMRAGDPSNTFDGNRPSIDMGIACYVTTSCIP